MLWKKSEREELMLPMSHGSNSSRHISCREIPINATPIYSRRSKKRYRAFLPVASGKNMLKKVLPETGTGATFSFFSSFIILWFFRYNDSLGEHISRTEIIF